MQSQPVLAILLSVVVAGSVFGQGNPQPKSFGTGLKKASQRELSALVESVPPKFGAPRLPVKYSLRNKLPSPGDQGNTNSCVAWAVGYGFMTGEVQMHASNGVSVERLSPNYLYHYCLIKDYGDYRGSGDNQPIAFETARSVIKESGICTFVLMQDYRFEPVQKAKENARFFETELREPTVDPRNRFSIKSILIKGRPLPFGMDVDYAFTLQDFHFMTPDGTKNWNKYSGGQRSGHAMLLIGWDDDRGAYEVVNSYGPNWGDDKGYLWIDYTFFEKNVSEIHNYFAPPEFRPAPYSRKGIATLADKSALSYCRIAEKNETTGKVDTFYFDVAPSDIEEGNLQPGSRIKVKPSAETVNLGTEVTISAAEGASSPRHVIDILHSGDLFEVQELKAFTIKNGTETHYWVGGKTVKD